MVRKTGPATALLRPILDMYMDSAVAVVGCQSRGMARDSCEYDVVVVTNDHRSPTSAKIGGVYVDLSFMSEKEALNPSNPEHSVSLATAKPVRDASLILSTSAAANAAILSNSSKQASSRRLASALKTLGRAEEAVGRDAISEADFWLLAGSYEFAYAWVYSRELSPSPSHLMSQLRGLASTSRGYFEAFSAGAGLEKASRAGCGARLEGLGVLHDVIRSGHRGKSAGHSAWSKARLDIVGGKARELASGIELAECYSYMGQELVDYIQAITARGTKRTLAVSDLFSAKEHLLADRLLKELGLTRTKSSVQKGLVSVRDSVSTLARIP